MNIKFNYYSLLSRLNIEVFKDIPGYEGHYQVSNLGRIKSLIRKNRKKEKILKLKSTMDGYFEICLYQNKKPEYTRTHRLILLTFKGKSDLYCNHKDCNKQNNKLYNLEYCTAKENTRHAFKNGLMENNIISLKKYRNIKKVKIKQYDKQGNYLNTFESTLQAEKITKIHNSAILRCVKNNKGMAGGFIWRKA